jgi:hypothetical protein
MKQDQCTPVRCSFFVRDVEWGLNSMLDAMGPIEEVQEISVNCCNRGIAPLAQLDRASGYEPEGREFESLRAHHSFQITTHPAKVPFGFAR